MKIENAVTGQLKVDGLNTLPSGSEEVGFLFASEGEPRGPNESFGNGWPECDGRIFYGESARAKREVSQLLDGENLKCEVPECAGTDIHLETIASGGFSLMIEALGLPSVTMSGIGTHPHLNERRNPVIFPKGVPQVPMEKWRREAVGMVKDDCRLESKDSE